MKSIIISILCFCTILSCTNSASTITETGIDNAQLAENVRAEKVALKHLFDKISTLPKTTLKEDLILIGDTTIRLKINVEFDEQKEGEWIYAANITTFFQTNKETKTDIGSIGIGTTRDEAISVCIQEWFATFGIAFTNMLKGDEHLNLSNMEAFPGLMGIRGNLPENTWLNGDDEMIKKIIGQFQESIKHKTSGLIPVDIKLKIGKNGISDGECRVDNEISSLLLENLKQLNWPPSDEGYIFKQFYIIKKTNP